MGCELAKKVHTDLDRMGRLTFSNASEFWHNVILISMYTLVHVGGVPLSFPLRKQARCPKIHFLNAICLSRSLASNQQQVTLIAGVLKRCPPEIGDRPISVLSNPPNSPIEAPKKGPIEPLYGPPTMLYKAQWRGLQSHRQGSIEPFKNKTVPILPTCLDSLATLIFQQLQPW